MDLFGILLIGLLVMFLFSAGFVALGLFGIGAVVYGLAILSEQWIATGLLVCIIFSKVERR